MKHKELFEIVRKAGGPTPEEAITALINRLIEALYYPTDNDYMFRVDKDRLKKYDIDESEPINWGDLKCSEVKADGGLYTVTIDEASPGACPTLCEYIEKYMASRGWNVKCETEW